MSDTETYNEDDLDQLRADAEAAGVKVDGRWGVERLREEIAAAEEDYEGEPQPEPETEDAEPEMSERDKKIERRECVVDDGTAHMGRAVNGLVCSAHAMHYLADGTPRDR